MTAPLIRLEKPPRTRAASPPTAASPHAIQNAQTILRSRSGLRFTPGILSGVPPKHKVSDGLLARYASIGLSFGAARAASRSHMGPLPQRQLVDEERRHKGRDDDHQAGHENGVQRVGEGMAYADRNRRLEMRQLGRIENRCRRRRAARRLE